MADKSKDDGNKKQQPENVLSMEEYKKKGNEEFKAGEYKASIKNYTKAIECPGITTDQLGTLFSNRSAAYNNSNKYDKALADANKSIEHRPDWCKGYFRKAEALFNKQEYSDAKKEYNTSLEKENKANVVIDERLRMIEEQKISRENGYMVRQLLPGRDLCLKTINPIQNMIFNYAKQMQNFIYLICDIESRETLIVDICWDMDGILKIAKQEKLKIVGAVVTHYHFDHTGGKPPPPFDSYPVTVDGIGKFVKKFPKTKVYVGNGDSKTIINTNGVPEKNCQKMNDDDTITLGKKTKIKFLSTPGHTPGSQCILINDKTLITGDTLFIGSSGRLDFPDSSVDDAIKSLTKLSKLANTTFVYPGHRYGGYCTTIGLEIQRGSLSQSGMNKIRNRQT